MLRFNDKNSGGWSESINLNTYHVKVQLHKLNHGILELSYLNTYHVKVQSPLLSTTLGILIAFKYISC